MVTEFMESFSESYDRMVRPFLCPECDRHPLNPMHLFLCAWVPRS